MKHQQASGNLRTKREPTCFSPEGSNLIGSSRASRAGRGADPATAAAIPASSGYRRAQSPSTFAPRQAGRSSDPATAAALHAYSGLSRAKSPRIVATRFNGLPQSSMPAPPVFSYVYILESQSHPNNFYVGLTHDLATRLRSHNLRENAHTAPMAPWTIKAAIALCDRQRAAALERYLKSHTGRRFAKNRL